MQKFNFFLGIILFFVQCKEYSRTEPPKNLIPKDSFIVLLAEIHKTDAMMTFRQMNDNQLPDKKISFYNSVFKKFHISRNTFDSNFRYYAANPVEMKILYGKVIQHLTKKSDEFLADSGNVDNKMTEKDLWNQKRRWSLPEDGMTNAIPFKIFTADKGTYTLRAKLKIYKDDETVAPKMTLLVHYSDGTSESNSNTSLVKNEEEMEYWVSITTNFYKEISYVSGWVLDHSSGTKTKHSEVFDVKLLYLPKLVR